MNCTLIEKRKEGGRGLKLEQILFESRVVALRQHLTQIESRSNILKFVYESEQNNILRIGSELLTVTLKMISKRDQK